MPSSSVTDQSYAPSIMPPPQTFDSLPPLHALLSRLDPSQSPYPKQQPLDAKDLPVEASGIKVRLQKARATVQELPETDKSLADQEEEIQELLEKIAKQKEVLKDLVVKAALWSFQEEKMRDYQCDIRGRADIETLYIAIVITANCSVIEIVIEHSSRQNKEFTMTKLTAFLVLLPLLGFGCADQAPLQASSSVSSAVSPKRVAIIGAGAGGASAAYHLSKYVPGCPFTPIAAPNITVFERTSYIGGRSITADVYGLESEPVELGASIFVEINHILVKAASELGLKIHSFIKETTTKVDDQEDDTTDRSIGIWNGEKFVFTQSRGGSWGKWWDLAKLFWRYGYSPIKAQNMMKEYVGKFLQLYDSHFPFTDLSAATYELGLAGAVASTGEQLFEEKDVNVRFTKDIVQASTRVNYGQNLGLIHGLGTMVCLATDGATSVEGGNYQIFQGMTKLSGAGIMLNTTVVALGKLESGFKVTYKTASTDNEVSTVSEDFDTVILAAPYQLSNISVTPPISIDPIPYVKLHVTIFATPHKLSSSYFNVPNPPEVILTTTPEDINLGSRKDGVGPAGFWSISLLRMITNPATGKEEHLYKIFSPQALNTTFLSSVFGISDPVSTDLSDFPAEDISWLTEKIWEAYPFLYPRVTFERPKIDEGLWYTSGMEAFISTMETSALMGKNIAKLISDEWVANGEGGCTAEPEMETKEDETWVMVDEKVDPSTLKTDL
ncbi:MAG: hypothetical protein M1834_001399 [Cirrosporium novae-zelandiae]|nr:MAG: hypothetical protein M1834_001399 [Cirrosporium novae-zelandiae]